MARQSGQAVRLQAAAQPVRQHVYYTLLHVPLHVTGRQSHHVPGGVKGVDGLVRVGYDRGANGVSGKLDGACEKEDVGTVGGHFKLMHSS